jgi:L-aspartate oxidase
VEALVDDGAELIDEILVSLAGVEFDRDLSGEYIFTQEAAHSKRRILHIGDTTGRAIMTALLRKIAQQPNVSLLTAHIAVDLLTFPHHGHRWSRPDIPEHKQSFWGTRRWSVDGFPRRRSDY